MLTALLIIHVQGAAHSQPKPAPANRPNTPGVLQIASVAYSPTGKILAVGGYQVVSLLDAASGRILVRLQGHPGAVTSVQFSRDGKWLAAAGGLPGRTGDVKLWDVSAIKPQGPFIAPYAPITLTGPSDVVYSAAFSPNGRLLAGASYDHDVNIWDVSSSNSTSKIVNRKSKILKDHIDSVYAVAFSSDGKLLASGAGDRTVKVWSVATGKRLYTLSESTAEVYALAFRPDGKQIAAGGADKQLRTWNITPTAGKLVKSAFAHTGAILHVMYAGDGQSVFTSGEDDAVKRWDSATLLERRVYPNLEDWPQGIALSPGDKQLAVGCHNGRLAIFDAATGRLVREPMKGTPVASKPTEMPRTSAIPGRKLGDNKQRRPAGNGGVTLVGASLGDISPRGAPRGGTVRFTLFGGLISDAIGVYFDDPAITAKIVTPSDSNPGVLRIDANLGSVARLGAHRVFVQTPHGATGTVPFAIGGWPEAAQVEPNDTPDSAQKISAPCTIVGSLDSPGDVDCYRFEGNAGQELVFEVIAQPLRSRLQPVLTLLDAGGQTLAESHPRIGRPDALLGYRFTRDGSYVLRLADFESAGGPDVHYRLNIGEFPVVTDVFPLGAKAGSAADIEVQGFNLGGARTAKVTVPADAGWGNTVGVPMETPSGPLYLTRTIQVGEDREVTCLPGNESPDRAQAVRVPCAINGRLAGVAPHPPTPSPKYGRGGDLPVAHYYRFHAVKGEPLTIDVMARRAGSPLDSEIEVLDSAGKPIERAVVRPIYQTDVVLSDRDSATNALRIFAWDGVGIGDYIMVGREVVKVVDMPRGPDSDIFFRAFRGQRLTYYGTTPEYHSVGQPVYKVEVHPPGATFSPNGYPVTRLTYRNDDGGPLLGKDSHLDFVAPREDDYLVRISDTRGQQGPEYAYRVLIHPPRPDYKLFLSPEHPNLPKAGAAVVNVECERYDGFEDSILVSLVGLPTGFTAGSTVIEWGETAASILITAAPDATTPSLSIPSPLRVVGRARIGGREAVRTVEPDNGARLLTVLPAPDARVSTDRQEVTIHPGEEVSLEVRLDRQGKFGGRVPIEVRNLPFGVQVQNIGLNGILVTEEDTTRSVTIRCDPWVKPQTRPFYVVANIEGGVPNAGPPLILKVLPANAGVKRVLTVNATRQRVKVTK